MLYLVQTTKDLVVSKDFPDFITLSNESALIKTHYNHAYVTEKLGLTGASFYKSSAKQQRLYFYKKFIWGSESVDCVKLDLKHTAVDGAIRDVIDMICFIWRDMDGFGEVGSAFGESFYIHCNYPNFWSASCHMKLVEEKFREKNIPFKFVILKDDVFESLVYLDFCGFPVSKYYIRCVLDDIYKNSVCCDWRDGDLVPSSIIDLVSLSHLRNDEHASIGQVKSWFNNHMKSI